jgi:DNA topoisomerase I
MLIAQQLYEKGYTTYHRTDSYNLSEQSINEAKDLIESIYGEKYWKGTQYKKKSKNSQEAHEAIRPSIPKETPEKIEKKLDKKQFALYKLIWKRFIASLMSSAILDQLTLEISTKPDKYLLRMSGQTIKFDGFLKIYPIKMEEKIMPSLEIQEILDLKDILAEQHFTQPPARYSEAALIKQLEEKGIGRPSTYAPTISVIQERNYVLKNDEKRFYPTEIGTLVSNLLVEHFPKIVDIDFTAEMEENLDKVAEGKIKWKSIIKDFYNPFIKNLEEKEKSLDKKDITEEKTDKKCEKCGNDMIIKIGRFGKFFACTNYPECKNTEAMEQEKSEENCEKCGGDMVLKRGRFGSFWGCSNYPECKNIRKNEKTTGINCPECLSSDERKDAPGEIVYRKSKKGRPFYGCNRYPECNFISNKKPEPSK